MKKIKYLWAWIMLMAAVYLGSLHIAFKAGTTSLSSDIEITWDAFNVSIAILEIYIVIFSIGISVLGFVGYNYLTKITEQKAQSTTKALLEDKDYRTKIAQQIYPQVLSAVKNELEKAHTNQQEINTDIQRNKEG